MNKTKPTPQQRIDALVREFDEMLKIFNIEDREPNEDEVKLESAVKQFIRHACTQAYLAGLEAVAESVGKLGVCARGRECPDWHGMCPDNLLSHISQLKEQITK